jgi:lysyl-tRNA synthetase class 1
MAAKRILEREQKLGRKVDVFKVESGLGASGIPHLGSLGDGARAYGMKLALEACGCKAKYIAFSDDKDGLRKVPAGLPESLEKYLGHPVNEVPDPFDCHRSYGEHMSSLLRDALDACGIEYEFVSAADAYKRGLFNEEIDRLLRNAEKVGQIIRSEVSQEKYVQALPYFAICEKCGRIYTTTALKYIADERKVEYKCDGMEVKGVWLRGCGHHGLADVAKGEGKLMWKVEFAMRWKALGIHVEAYGKDIADSVRVNDRVSQEILGYPPPFHIRYEMFLDKGGRKISKSAGNVFTPQVWLRYGSPQSLLLLMYKRVVGSRTISVSDIATYMREFDDLEDVYFGVKQVADPRERAKLRGLYEYCWLLRPPSKPSVHVPYNLLVYLVKVAPKGREAQFAASKLKGYGLVVDEKSSDFLARVRYAQNWAEDFEEITEAHIELTQNERAAIEELIQLIKTESDDQKIQNGVFAIARKHSLEAPAFFRVLYQILIGGPEGPRLGPYIVAMGRDNVADALSRALIV